MTAKIGRNDPCSCGSGKKYKHCCGKPESAASASADSHEGAIARAVTWLGQYHRKAFFSALDEEIYDAVLACVDDDAVAAEEAMDDIDDSLMYQLQINLTEWLMAEGDIAVKDDYLPVSELLLGPRGPLFSVGQRAWLAQLAERPLRLYDVTDVDPGTSVTLCDALDTEQAPIVVDEREGSRPLRPGMQMGARIMAVGDRHQLSGAVYLFSMMAGRAVQDELRRCLEYPDLHEEDIPYAVSREIIEGWLAQHLLPAPLPDFVDARSGEPMLFTTDHFEVRDWAALEAVLSTQPDVKGSPESGWDRLTDDEDGLTRATANIAVQHGAGRVSLLTRTASMADSERLWFEGLAGNAVRFQLREISDPKGMLSARDPSVAPAAGSLGLPEGIDPKELSAAIAGVMKRSYANWADQPIPALNGQTPRQAIATPAGLERVKGLLRSYESGEADMAAKQGRDPISYQFLWDELGLPRS